MSTEPSTRREDARNASQPALNAFLPLVLIAASVFIVLVWQVAQAFEDRSALQNNITRLEAATGPAIEAQKRLESFVMDLLELSKTNADARKIVAKYKIQYTPKAENRAASEEKAAEAK